MVGWLECCMLFYLSGIVCLLRGEGYEGKGALCCVVL